jgi:SSS family solute:Na+ symporter
MVLLSATRGLCRSYLAGVTVFGTRFRRSQRTMGDYFLGRRNIGWGVISLSIVATETSTLTLVGIPAMAFATYARPEQGGNFTYLQVVLGYIVARVLVSVLFVPAYYAGRLFTAYELLEHRFGTAARHVTASLFLLMRPLAEGVRVFAASLVLAAVVGASLPHLPGLWLWAIVAMGVLTLVYTFEGGMTAVIWTDLIQFVIYAAGSLLAAVLLWRLVPGGAPAIIAAGRGAAKFRVLSFSTNLTVPFTFWAGLVGGTFLTMASHGTDQLLVQRLLACRSARDSQKALIASGVIVLAQFALFLTIGVMLYAYYRVHPVPSMTTADGIFPAFIVSALPHGVSGLVIAAMLAAAMSTLSGSLNALASTTVVDFYLPLTGRRLDDRQTLALSRWLTAGWGVLLMAIAILARGWGSVFTAGLTIASIVYGPMLGAFLLGRLTARTSQAGVITGIAVSLACMIWITLATPLAWTWYVLVGTVVCMAVGYGTSLVVGVRRRTTEIST